MQRRSKDVEQKIQWKQGSSMVEILVAFLIVVMTVAGFGKVISASNHLLQQSRQVIAQTTDFDAEFYKKNVSKTSVDGSVSLKLKDVGITMKLTNGNFQKVTVDGTGMTRYLVNVDENSAGGGASGE